jgi:thiol-disulfide isomerase/thioredoxin
VKLRRPPVVRAVVLGVLALVLLSGCGAQGTGFKGYIDGQGVITEVKAAQRKPLPGNVVGKTLEGKKVDLANYRGKVVVVNFWWSACGPCRKEAPSLSVAAAKLIPKGVVFLGIDIRDGATSMGKAYQSRFDVPYPSVFDPDGETLLAFRGTLSPNSIPSTVILDKQGRVAASVLGGLDSNTTLYDLVNDAGGPNLTRDS